MIEKSFLSPVAEKIFKPEKLKQMEIEAEKEMEKEKIRSGELMPADDELEPEECSEMENKKDTVVAPKVHKIKPGTRSESVKKVGAANYGWLNVWQDKNEIDKGKRRKIN